MFQGRRIGLQNRLARFDSEGICFEPEKKVEIIMKLIAEIIVWASRICFIGAISFAGIALVIAAVLQLMNNDGRLAFGIVTGIL